MCFSCALNYYKTNNKINEINETPCVHSDMIQITSNMVKNTTEICNDTSLLTNSKG